MTGPRSVPDSAAVHSGGSPASVVWRNLAIASAAAFLLLLAMLHVAKPTLDPSWRMISEYAIGDYGWMMQMAFLVLGSACLCDCVVARAQLTTLGSRIGWGLLAIAGVSLMVAGAFVSDPITATPVERTTHGFVHGISAIIGIPSLSIAPLLEVPRI